MSVLTSPKAYAALAAMQAGDAVACAIPVLYIAKSFDTLGLSPGVRRILPVVKVASAVGLLSAARFPWLARLTTFMLTIYFVLAVGAHVRVKDRPVNAIPAAGLLATFAFLTVKGPDASG
ncbi:DoxX family protein [Mycobacterium hubeiense]|uniref:DoxX family protein n=1 Tax=Mycobacterium hubeiense TaxID=1867256 RepID=UPI000C7F4AFF|nr:DoxX family protein [Mycobacterium sp. QGD 101]